LPIVEIASDVGRVSTQVIEVNNREIYFKITVSKALNWVHISKIEQAYQLAGEGIVVSQLKTVLNEKFRAYCEVGLFAKCLPNFS
jgi:hypothetical protein